MTYGVGVNGMTDGELSGLRRMVARTYGPMRGRSVAARLALENADPANRAVVGK